MDYRTYLKNYPDDEGRFGPYGGMLVPDELIPAFEEIERLHTAPFPTKQFNTQI